MKLAFDRLSKLLTKCVDDPEIIELLEIGKKPINQIDFLGFVTLRDQGISIVFREAPWVIPEREITDPKAFYIGAFHFHKADHEGHSQFAGKLPNGVAFGDSESDLVHKLGEPLEKGGGGFSKLTNKPIQFWLKYRFGEAMLRFQLDDSRQVEMVTLLTPDLQQAKYSDTN